MTPTPPPKPADVRKFLHLFGVSAEHATPFCKAVHDDWAEDLSEVLFYCSDRTAKLDYQNGKLGDVVRSFVPVLKAAGVGLRKLPKPKKRVPAGHEAYHAEVSVGKREPVRLLLTRDPDLESAPTYLRELDTALRAFGLGVYLDLRWLDADHTGTCVLTDRDWQQVGKWLGDGVRDRLFVPAGRLPDTRAACEQLQWRLWTGSTKKRPEEAWIYSWRDMEAARLSRAFLAEHRAELDALGKWEEVNEHTYLHVRWKRPKAVDQSWVPLDVVVSVEADEEEHVGCGVGRFDPPDRTFAFLRKFLNDQKGYLEKAKQEIASWEMGKPRRGAFEIIWSQGEPQVAVAVWFRGQDEEDDPERCYFDPDTGEVDA